MQRRSSKSAKKHNYIYTKPSKTSARVCAPLCLCLARCASSRFEESVGARLTLLEGRLKLAEAQVGR
jgi:hypothetical protein